MRKPWAKGKGTAGFGLDFPAPPKHYNSEETKKISFFSYKIKENQTEIVNAIMTHYRNLLMISEGGFYVFGNGFRSWSWSWVYKLKHGNEFQVLISIFQ